MKQGKGREPVIITLCGSVKFWDEYRKWNAILTMQGNVVLSCGLSLKSGYEDVLKDYSGSLDDLKERLDAIHLRKIDLSDGIFVLNVGGYIGDSTQREIEYAKSKGKFVKYLEHEQQVADPDFLDKWFDEFLENEWREEQEKRQQPARKGE